LFAFGVTQGDFAVALLDCLGQELSKPAAEVRCLSRLAAVASTLEQEIVQPQQ
jgi:hypothetical protein